MTRITIVGVTLPYAISNFEAGKSYKVVMTIHGPKIIEAKASLTPWEESSDEINLELN